MELAYFIQNLGVVPYVVIIALGLVILLRKRIYRAYVWFIVREYILIKYRAGLINEETKQQLLQKLNA